MKRLFEYRFLYIFPFRCMNTTMPLDLNKLKRKTPLEILERPKKKIDRFDGLSEEEVQKYTLEDYLEMDLDIVFVGINPSLMAAHRGRYYAGPGNHFYKLLHESGLTPRFVNFEEDYKLLRYRIGLTNIVTRATRSAADLKRTEIKEGAKVVEEKLKVYKPTIAVFNGKCIYEVFANITNRSSFHFGLQPERINDTAIWVTPSTSARCANFPRMVDKLPFYAALKKYLNFLKGEITDVDANEFCFDGKCKQSVPSTSKMWRRKNISIFQHGGRIVNKNTLCQDTSEEDIAAVHAAEFLVQTCDDGERSNGDKEITSQENENETVSKKTVEKTEKHTKRIDNLVAINDTDDGPMITNKIGNKEISDIDINIEESCDIVVNNVLSQENNITGSKNRKYACSRNTRRIVKNQNNVRSSNRDNSLDFMDIIKQRLSQKSNNDDIMTTTTLIKQN